METQWALIVEVALFGLTQLGVALYKFGRVDESLKTDRQMLFDHAVDIKGLQTDHSVVAGRVSRIEGELAS